MPIPRVAMEKEDDFRNQKKTSFFHGIRAGPEDQLYCLHSADLPWAAKRKWFYLILEEPDISHSTIISSHDYIEVIRYTNPFKNI